MELLEEEGEGWEAGEWWCGEWAERGEEETGGVAFLPGIEAVVSKQTGTNKIILYTHKYTVCPRSLVHLCISSHYIKWTRLLNRTEYLYNVC